MRPDVGEHGVDGASWSSFSGSAFVSTCMHACTYIHASMSNFLNGCACVVQKAGFSGTIRGLRSGSRLWRVEAEILVG